MTKEIRKETDWLGKEKDVIYEDGKKVGETRHETDWLGSPKDITYDNSGNKISETRHETTLFGPSKEVTYDTHGKKVSETRYEEEIFGGKKGVIYEDGKKIGELKTEKGVFGGRRQVLHESGEHVDPLTRGNREREPNKESNNSGSDSYGDYSSYGTSSNSLEERTKGFSAISFFATLFIIATAAYLFTNEEHKKQKDYESSGSATAPRYHSPVEENLAKFRSKPDSAYAAHKAAIEKFRLKTSLSDGEIKKNAIETGVYESPIEKRETIARETPAQKKTSPLESKEERVRTYNAILPSSEFSQSTPKGYAPVIVETRDANGNVTIKAEHMSRQEMERQSSDDIGITYPSSNRRYVIERERYPKFYDRLDLDMDGKVSLYELGEAQSTIYNITDKKKEGDLDAVIKEFLKKYKPKKHR